ncbi:MAG: PQQ-dependent sugar dehydrogenase [Rhizobacter sp.]|nr:PQQ-dependent sugar dehydrogenase [Rhizobacter sp.]
MNTARSTRPWCAALLCCAIAACGGGDEPLPPPSAQGSDRAPVLTLTAPEEGATFAAGETLPLVASAVDAEDGPLADGRITWWVDRHLGTQVVPLQPPTAGGTGSVTIPTRNEVSPNIWYRVHVRATDSAGHSVEITRDLQPRTAEVTLATQPPGLSVTLDGQPVTGPHTFTGVQGVERDLAAADQVLGGRRYAFASWSDGGAAAHTVSTPAATTTYTATFTDLGTQTNTPPSVSLSAVASAVVGTPITLSASAADSDGNVVRVQFFDGSTPLGEATASPWALAWTPATAGTHHLTARATDDDGDTTVSTAVAVSVSAATGPDGEAPVATLTAPADLATPLSGSVTLQASATDNVGVASVEFQVDGTALGSADTSAPYEAAWDTAAFPAGQHVLRARARDAAGNVSPWATSTVQVGGNTAVPQGFTKTDDWVDGLRDATAFAEAPDGRLFIAEQGGRVRIVKNGRLLALPFLTLDVDDRGERGLIGIALHPSFATSPWVYVHYTTGRGGHAHNRISCFLALGDLAVGLEDRLVDLPELSNATNHNGGALHFGVDGKLYVGVGDNADATQAPDLSLPFGKLLRFNDDGSIPADNPYYASQSGVARAIWASGLRNPFTFAVQPGTGRIHINDVGQDTWEEINLGTAGASYGWPATEGPTTAAGVTAPLFTYRHDSATPAGSGPGGFFVGQCIAGGAFYPASGGRFPASYRGNYFFADYLTGFIGRLDPANGHAGYRFAQLSGGPVDLLVGQDGALYALTRSGVTRIAPTP